MWSRQEEGPDNYLISMDSQSAINSTLGFVGVWICHIMRKDKGGARNHSFSVS